VVGALCMMRVNGASVMSQASCKCESEDDGLEDRGWIGASYDASAKNQLRS